MIYCTNCEDAYEPLEARDGFVDPDVPHFCSVECEDEFKESAELQRVYDSAAYGAPLF